MAYLGQGPFQEFSNPPTKDSFTGDGSTVAFDLASEVPSGSQNALEVYVDNVRQEPGTGKAFTLGVDGSGDTKRITFSAAPANNASIYVINDKTNSTIVAPLQNDLNGTELILDTDGDTSITADTDDRIDFKIANVEHFSFSNSSGDTIVKPMVDAKDIKFQQYDGRTLLDINDGGFIGIANGATGSGELRIYEDTDNGTNYSGFKVGAQSADIDYVLPTADGSSGTKLTTNGSGTLSWAATNVPTSADGQALGSASLEWSDLFLADGAVINFGADQDINLTHVADTGLTTNGDFTVGDDLFVSGGVIDLKNTGTASQIHLYCEASNAHAQIIQGAPHSQAASNTLILPDGGNGTLLSTVSTATVTNKTFTSPKINEDVAVTATATEINLIDGGATVGTTAIADGDGLIINDAGTMRVSTVQTLAAYLDDEITAMPNLVTTAATTVGALNSGSIASGFGNIDNGVSNITSGGLVKLDVDADADDVSGDSATGRLTIGAGEDLNLYHGGTNSYIVNDTGDLIIKTGASDEDFIIKGNDGGSEITALTLDMSAAGAAAFNSTVTATGFIIGSANIGEAELEILDGLASTTAELAIIDGDTSAGTTAVAGGDGIVTNDNGTMRQTTVDTFDTYLSATTKTLTNKTLTTPVITEIDSGSTITLDATTDIILDADGGDIFFKDGGTTIATHTNSSSDYVITTGVQDKDFIVKGDDGGSAITALTLDMSAGGQATFNASVIAKTDTDTSNTGNVTLDFTANQNFVLTLTGNTTLVNPSTETVGQSGFIAFIQDGTGGRTVTLGTDYETAAGAGLSLTSTASATDLVPYVVVAANRILLGTPQLAFS